MIAIRDGGPDRSNGAANTSNDASVSWRAVPVCRIGVPKFDRPEKIWTSVVFVPVPDFLIAQRSGLPTPIPLLQDTMLN